MNNIPLIDQLTAVFPDLQLQAEVPLAPYTTVKIGGPAQVLATTNTTAEMEALVVFCRQNNIPITMLGWGANSLIADRGIRGLVIRNLARELEVEDSSQTAHTGSPITEVSPRYVSTIEKQAFDDLDYDESAADSVVVTLAAGWPLPSLIAQLLQQGVTGLQWYARIPATLGGAVVNNVHGGSHFLSEQIISVDVITATGERQTRRAAECDFSYDYSRFHHSDEIITRCRLQLRRGDTDRARRVIAEWAKRKQHQPQNSLGCIFQNLDLADQQRLELPTPSIGFIIDKVLLMKGFSIGDAAISEYHAAFITNQSSATASQYLAVIKEIQARAAAQCQLFLKPEIFFLGFTEDELTGVHTPFHPGVT